jgi:hypothetical protein
MLKWNSGPPASITYALFSIIISELVTHITSSIMVYTASWIRPCIVHSVFRLLGALCMQAHPQGFANPQGSTRAEVGVRQEDNFTLPHARASRAKARIGWLNQNSRIGRSFVDLSNIFSRCETRGRNYQKCRLCSPLPQYSR